MIIMNCMKFEHYCGSTSSFVTCAILYMLQPNPTPLHSTNSASLPVGPSFVYLARIKKQPGEVHQIIPLNKKYTSTSIQAFNWPFKNISTPYNSYDRKHWTDDIFKNSKLPKTHNTLQHEAKQLQQKRPSSSKSPDAWRLSMPQSPGGPELRWI